MLGHVQRPAHAAFRFGLPHQDDRIGVAQHVATLNRPLDQRFEHRFVRRTQQQAPNLGVLVSVLRDGLGVGPVLSPK